MADPFSIVTGVLTISEVTARVGKYVKAVHRSAQQIDTQIELLRREIESFRSIYLALETLCTAATEPPTSATPLSGPMSDTSISEMAILWQRAADQVEIGQGIIESLEAIMIRIVGPEISGDWQKFEKVRKATRMVSQEKQYQKLLLRLRHIKDVLNITFTALEL